MKLKSLSLIILITIFVSLIFLQSAICQEISSTLDSSGNFNINREIENVAFKAGESLKFVIRFGPVQAGNAYMDIEEVFDYNNRRCYRMVTRAESNAFFSTFYKVRDRTISIIDSTGLFPWHFEKKLREGKYKADIKFIYDQINQQIITKNDTIPTPLFIHDDLSSFYFLRTQDLQVGTSYTLDHFSDKSKHRLEVKILRRETIRVRAGKFSCLVVEPLLKSAGVFKSKGKVTVWLTDDQYRMPVLMKSKVLVGSVIAELVEHKGVYPKNK